MATYSGEQHICASGIMGGDKSDTSNVQQSDRQKKRIDGISEGDGIIVGGKSNATEINDMNAAENKQ